MNQKKSKRGGARPGAGRPKGSTDRVSVDLILATLEAYSGQTYAEILAQDFEEAHAANDRGVVLKYHNLIMNKIAPTLQSVEVANTADQVAEQQATFEQALQRLQALSHARAK